MSDLSLCTRTAIFVAAAAASQCFLSVKHELVQSKISISAAQMPICQQQQKTRDFKQNRAVQKKSCSLHIYKKPAALCGANFARVRITFLHESARSSWLNARREQTNKKKTMKDDDDASSAKRRPHLRSRLIRDRHQRSIFAAPAPVRPKYKAVLASRHRRSASRRRRSAPLPLLPLPPPPPPPVATPTCTRLQPRARRQVARERAHRRRSPPRLAARIKAAKMRAARRQPPHIYVRLLFVFFLSSEPYKFL